MSTIEPTPAQIKNEAKMRKLGITMSFRPSGMVPHDCPAPNPRCFRCQLEATASRLNGGEA